MCLKLGRRGALALIAPCRRLNPAGSQACRSRGSLLRLVRGLAGRDEVYSLRDVEGLDHETLSVALALTMAAVNERYTAAQWKHAARAMEKAVVGL